MVTLKNIRLLKIMAMLVARIGMKNNFVLGLPWPQMVQCALQPSENSANKCAENCTKKLRRELRRKLRRKLRFWLRPAFPNMLPESCAEKKIRPLSN